MALVKNPSPFYELEEIVYNVSTSHLSSPIKKSPLFQKDIPHPICVSKASTSSLQAIFSKTKEDMQGFQNEMSRSVGSKIKYNEKCPPKKTYILIRSEPPTRFKNHL